MSLSTEKPSVSITYVHSEGAVSLAYTPDARYLYSGGADGIRCFDLNESIDAAKTIEYHKDPVTYLDCSSKFLASCSESGETALHEHQTSQFNSLITRTSLPTRCIKFSPNQRKLAVSSDEQVITIIDVQDPLNCFLLTGHTRPVKSLCWSHDSTELVSSGCDGTVRLWNINNQSASDQSRCLQVIDNIISTVTSESYHSIEAIWHPSGTYFVVPSRESGLAILSKNFADRTWKLSKLVCQPDLSKQTIPITALRFSPNGEYLVTGYGDGMITVWSTQTWSPEASIQPEAGSAITAIQWQPKANSIAAANELGQVTTWQHVILPTKISPFNDSSLPVLDAGIENDDSELFRDQPAAHSPVDDAFDQEDWVIDDIPTTRNLGKNGLDKNSYTSKHFSRHQKIPRHLSDVHGQEPFQPGATTIRPGSSLENQVGRRYMAFNLLGLVHVLEKEDENIVTVEFHDKGLRNGYHFTDNFKFNLSSIGNLGVAFACKSTRSNPSLIRYEPFESWTTSGLAFGGSEQIGTDEEASWQFELPQGESVTCIACGGRANEDGKMEMEGLVGSGTVAVGTNQGYVRLFSGSGIQTYIWHLGQQIIALACSHEFLFVVHRSSILSQTHPLHYTLMDTGTFEIVQDGSMPLPNLDVVLTWIGFSQSHSIPACYDSAGVLSFLDKSRRPRQGRWVPMLNTASLKSETQIDRVYWPVGVSETELSCIILRGGETQPPIPVPVIQEVSLQMPLLQHDSPQGLLEESYLRGSLIHNHQADLADPDDTSIARQLSIDQLELDKQLLKLVEICCKAEPTPSLQKALDYTILLKNMNTLEASMKICKFFNLAGLSERVSKLLEARELESDLSSNSRDLAKRKSKYTHLEDYNIITNSKISTKRKATNPGLDLFDKPFAELPNNIVGGPNQLFNQSNVFTVPAPSRRIDQVAPELQEDDHTFPLTSDVHDELTTDSLMHDVEDEVVSFNSTSKRPKLSEFSLSSQVTNTPRESTNPFAKKPPKPGHTLESSDHSSSTANLFGSKKPTSSRTPELKKSGKFFARVDERNGVVTPHKNSKNSKEKQATLSQFHPKNLDTLDDSSSKKINKNSSRKIGENKKNNEESLDHDVQKNKNLVQKSVTGFLKPKFQATNHNNSSSSNNNNNHNNDEGDQHDTQMKEGMLNAKDPITNLDEDSQLSLASVDFSQSLPPRIRSTLPPPDDSPSIENQNNHNNDHDHDSLLTPSSIQLDSLPDYDNNTAHDTLKNQSKLEVFRSKIK